jgi:hypothetical protein
MDERRPTNNDLLHHTQATAGGHFFYALGGGSLLDALCGVRFWVMFIVVSFGYHLSTEALSEVQAEEA